MVVWVVYDAGRKMSARYCGEIFPMVIVAFMEAAPLPTEMTCGQSAESHW